MNKIVNILALFFLFANFLHAQNGQSRLFSQVQIMDEHLKILLEKEGQKPTSWHGNYEGFNRPDFAYYKAIQLFYKLNAYRVSKGYGPIALPSYPTKKVTNEELYTLLKLFSRQLTIVSGKQVPFLYHKPQSYNELYKRLSHVLDQLNLLNHIDSGTPTDAYNDAEEILASIKALRTIQMQTKNPLMPEKKFEQLPNDSLVAARKLLESIEASKRNLWIQPSKIADIPKRSIRPDDVKNLLTKAKIELETIKQRLGLEYQTKSVKTKEIKTSSDVVQILEYARLMMPQFRPQDPIFQKKQITEAQEYAKSMSIAHFILSKLQNTEPKHYDYKSFSKLPNLELSHYFFLIEESFLYLDKARSTLGLKPTAHPVLPKELSIYAISQLLLRLDAEFNILKSKKEGLMLAQWQPPLGVGGEPFSSNLIDLLHMINATLKQEFDTSISNYDLYAASYIINDQIEDLAKFAGKPKKRVDVNFQEITFALLEKELIALHKHLITIQSRANIAVQPFSPIADTTLTKEALYHLMTQLKVVLHHMFEALELRSNYPVARYKNYSLQSIYTKLTQAQHALHKVLNP